MPDWRTPITENAMNLSQQPREELLTAFQTILKNIGKKKVPTPQELVDLRDALHLQRVRASNPPVSEMPVKGGGSYRVRENVEGGIARGKMERLPSGFKGTLFGAAPWLLQIPGMVNTMSSPEYKNANWIQQLYQLGGVPYRTEKDMVI